MNQMVVKSALRHVSGEVATPKEVYVNKLVDFSGRVGLFVGSNVSKDRVASIFMIVKLFPCRRRLY
jgi:hypothetical protein